MSAPSLTQRERESLAMIASGKKATEAAHALGISPETVKDHLTRVRLKLGATTTAQAAVMASRAGII